MNPVQPSSSTPCSTIGRHARHCRSFTLIELLVVVAIMMILAGLLFPAVRSSIRRAEAAKARAEVRQIAIGLEAFYAYYKFWPFAVYTSGWNRAFAPAQEVDANTFPMDALMVGILSGTWRGYLANGSPASRFFFAFTPKQLDAGTNHVDQWGNVYQMRFDVDRDGQIPNPFESSTSITVSASVLVWSAGPDKTNDTAGESSAFNKDNIKSWSP
jgi:type II secretory pathway pseudopilin PulG